MTCTSHWRTLLVRSRHACNTQQLCSCACSLGSLVCRIQEPSTVTVLTELCTKMLTGKAEPQRDLAAIGIKGVIAEAPASLSPVLAQTLGPKLITGVKSKVCSCVQAMV